MTIDNTALSCNGHSKRNEWWVGNLAAKVCARVHYVSQSQRRYSSMNGEAGHWYCWKSWHRVHPGSFKFSWREIICQRRMRVPILETKTLQDIRYQKAFASVQTLWSDKSRYGWQLRISGNKCILSSITYLFRLIVATKFTRWKNRLPNRLHREYFYLKTAEHQPSTSEGMR